MTELIDIPDTLDDSQAVIVTDTTGMTHQEWLEARRDGIGGSDAATVCGLNPWQSAFGLWIDKTSPAPEADDAGEAATWGTLLEPVVRDEVARREALSILECPFLLAHPERAWQQANIDGLIPGPEGTGIYEGKTAHTFLAGDWDDDQIPARYIIQVQHYLSVTGWDWALVACLVGGQRLIIRRLERDDDLIGHLAAIEADFWDAVVSRTPPAPDGSKATTDVLTHLYDVEPGLIATVDETTVAEILTRRAEAETAEKAAKEAKDTASNELRMLLGDATEAHTADGRCLYTWRPQTTRRVNTKALSEEHPDLVELFTTETESRVLRVKKGAMK